MVRVRMLANLRFTVQAMISDRDALMALEEASRKALQRRWRLLLVTQPA